jgi:hypothetical protein
MDENDPVAAKLHGTTDAQVWAQEFVRLHGGDEGLMIGWFANAIETGRGAQRESEREAFAAFRESWERLTGDV